MPVRLQASPRVRFLQGLELSLHVIIGTGCLLTCAIIVNYLKISTKPYPKQWCGTKHMIT